MLAPSCVTPTSDPQAWELIDAADRGDLARVEAALEVLKDVNAQNEAGWSAVLYSANGGHGTPAAALEITRRLIARGADVNVAERDGWTPLLRAAHNGHLDIVRLLLENGANTAATNGDGEDAFDVARTRGKREIADIILNYPAELEERRKRFAEELEQSAVLQQNLRRMKPLKFGR